MSGDALWTRDEIESPCIKVCVIHPGAGICVGCHRTADEIAGWSALSPEDRAAVMAALPDRAPQLKERGARPSARRAARRRSLGTG